MISFKTKQGRIDLHVLEIMSVHLDDLDNVTILTKTKNIQTTEIMDFVVNKIEKALIKIA